MKEDLRVLKTKDNIYQGMLKLLTKYSFKEITVNMLCSECRINKTTFYRHYLDKYDLVEQATQNLLTEFQDVSHLFKIAIKQDQLNSLLNFFDKHKEELLILESKILPINIFQDMYTILSDAVSQLFTSHTLNQGLIKLYSSLIANNILVTIKWYHKEAVDLSREELINTILLTVDTGIQQTIDHLSKR